MKSFFNVFAFSYLERLRAKSFLISTIIGVVLLGLLVSVPQIYQQYTKMHQDTIAVVDETHQYVQASTDLRAAISNQYNWVIDSPSQESALRDQVKNGDLAALVTVRQSAAQMAPSVEMTVKSEPDSDLLQPLQNYMQNLYTKQAIQKLALNPQQVAQMTAQVPLQIQTLSTHTQSMAPVYVMMLLLYMAIMSYGAAVANSVAAEKSSRIQEVLITSARPVWLLFGKVVGVGLVGLTQYVILLGATALVYKLVGTGPINMGGAVVDFASVPGILFLYLGVFFLLGYFFFATLFAALGSLVSRSEEVQQAMMPLVLLVVVAFFAAMYSLSHPDSTVSVVASFIPCFTPMVMMVRIGMTDVAVWQILLSILLMLLAIGGGCYLSAKIYRVGVLMYGKRPSLKEVFVALKSYQA